MKQYFSFVCGIVAVFFLIGCTTPQPSTPATLPAQETTSVASQNNRALNIVTTFPPLYAHAANVLDENDTLINLVPPGTSIHTWQPRPSDIVAMEGADLIITNGLGLEEFLQPYLETLTSQGVLVVDTSVGVSILEYKENQDETQHSDHNEDDHGDDDHDEDEHGHTEEEHHDEHLHNHEGEDPHIWLDIANAKQQVENISLALIEADPSQEEWYTTQTLAYIERLEQLDISIRSQLEATEVQPFVVFHDAYQYFFQSYGLDVAQVGLIQEFHGDAPSQRAISELIELIEDNNVQTIYTEPQFNPMIVQRLTQETEIQTKEIDPIGSELSSEGYSTMMSALTQAFIQ